MSDLRVPARWGNGRLPLLVLGLCLAAAVTGCGKKDAAGTPGAATGPAAAGPAAATPGTAGTPFPAPIVSRLKDEGFTVGAFATTAPEAYGARRCVRGEVDQLDVLLCEYPSPAAAAAGKQLATFAAGAVSGASRQADAVMVTVADRKQVDLSGKRINRLLRAATGAAPAAPAAPPAPGAPPAPAPRPAAEAKR